MEPSLRNSQAVQASSGRLDRNRYLKIAVSLGPGANTVCEGGDGGGQDGCWNFDAAGRRLISPDGTGAPVKQVAGLEFRKTSNAGLPGQYFPRVFFAGLLGEAAAVGQGGLVRVRRRV